MAHKGVVVKGTLMCSVCSIEAPFQGECAPARLELDALDKQKQADRSLEREKLSTTRTLVVFALCLQLAFVLFICIFSYNVMDSARALVDTTADKLVTAITGTTSKLQQSLNSLSIILGGAMMSLVSKSSLLGQAVHRFFLVALDRLPGAAN